MTRIDYTATVAVQSQPDALLDFVLDFGRYTTVEPRLRSAVWIAVGDQNRVGARARVVTSTQFRFPILNHLFGTVETLVTLVSGTAPGRVVAELTSSRFAGRVTLVSVEVDQRRSVHATATIDVKHPPLVILVKAARPLLAARGADAIAAAIHRADTGLRAGRQQ